MLGTRKTPRILRGGRLDRSSELIDHKLKVCDLEDYHDLEVEESETSLLAGKQS